MYSVNYTGRYIPNLGAESRFDFSSKKFSHNNTIIDYKSDDEYIIRIELEGEPDPNSEVLVVVDKELVTTKTFEFMGPTIIYSGVIALGALWIVIYYLKLNLSIPLSLFIDQIKDVSPDSIPNIPKELRIRNDELGIVARSFEEMLYRLSHSRKLLEKSNTELFVLTEELEHRVEVRTKELEEVNRKLDTIAHIDVLTGCLNRLSFEEIYEQHFERAKYNNHNFAVFVIDLDGFKKVNHRLGHTVGDCVLNTIGRRIRLLSRYRNNFFRISGGKFVLILEEYVDEFSFIKVIQNLEENIFQSVLYRGEDVPLGVSIGVASTEYYEKSDADELLMCADSAMYEAKRKGVNCVFKQL